MTDWAEVFRKASAADLAMYLREPGLDQKAQEALHAEIARRPRALPPPHEPSVSRVVISGIDMSFGSILLLAFKFGIAFGMVWLTLWAAVYWVFGSITR